VNDVKRIRFEGNKILSITSDGLVYLDDQEEKFIDFKTCRRNWVQYVNHSGDFKTTGLSERDTTCVAWRDFFSKPPYIEFFTQPRTRFEFFAPPTFFERLLGRPARGWVRDFIDMQLQIGSAGWASFDLG